MKFSTFVKYLRGIKTAGTPKIRIRQVFTYFKQFIQMENITKVSDWEI